MTPAIYGGGARKGLRFLYRDLRLVVSLGTHQDLHLGR